MARADVSPGGSMDPDGGDVVYWFSVAVNAALENAGRWGRLCDAGPL